MTLEIDFHARRSPSKSEALDEDGYRTLRMAMPPRTKSNNMLGTVLDKVEGVGDRGEAEDPGEHQHA